MNSAYARTGLPITTLVLLMLFQQATQLPRFAEGATIDWDNVAGGDYGVAQNWNPAQVPGFLDVARFDLGDQTYEIDFFGINRSPRRVIIADDDVTFDLGGASLDAFASSNSLVVGDAASLLVALRDTASLNVFDGEVIAVNVILGRDGQPGSHGTTVRASGRLHLRGSLAPSTMTIREGLTVGDAGNGTLEVDYGGVLRGDGGTEYTATIANQVNSIGTAVVERATWSDIGTLRVGNAGSGSLNLINAGMVTARRAYVAAQPGSSGNILVDGSVDQSRLLILDELQIGGEAGNAGGQGTLTITGQGAAYGSDTTISDSGTVVLDGGRLSVHTLSIAPQGTFDWVAGRLVIPNLSIDTSSPLGEQLTIGATRELEASRQLHVAPAGQLILDGGLIVTDELDLDGTFTWNTGVLHMTDNLVVETGAPIGDQLTVAGDQSLLVEELPGLAGLRTLHVGRDHSGLLTLSGGATARADEIAIGLSSGGDGTIAVSDPGTSLTTPRTLDIAAAGSGQLMISNGAQVAAQFAKIGMQEGADGSVTLQGLGSSLNVVTDVSGQTDLPIGGEGSGVVNVLAGAVVQTEHQDVVLGDGSSGSGTINIDGMAAWQFLYPNVDTITIGKAGEGVLNITGGGMLSSGKGVIAQDAGTMDIPHSRGFVTIDGRDTAGMPSFWDPTTLDVGQGGEGHLEITGGGLLVTQELHVGSGSSAEGYIRVDGAGSELRVAANSAANLLLGLDGFASLDVSGAGQVSAHGVFIGDGSTAVAVASVTGSNSSIHAEDVTVGWMGNGSLHVSAGGSVVSNTAGVAVLNGSDGNVVLDSGGTWAVMADLTLGDGVGAVHVNEGGELHVGDTILVGPQGVIAMNGGTLTAATIDAQSGGIFDLQAGTLSVETFDGDLVNVGGVVAPGRSPGLTSVVGNYEQQSEATLALEIGGDIASQTHDVLAVFNSALLDGELHVTLIDGFLPAPYEAITIVTADDGIQGIFSEVVGVSYAADYGLAVTYGSNQVDLQAALLGDANLDGVVDGGDFIVWNTHKFTASNTWGTGDFNGDGLVDGQDFLLWNGNKFTSSDVLSSVPEPNVGLVLLAALMGMVIKRRS